MENQAEIYRWVVESSHDGLWMLDVSGRVIFANHRMAELVGREPEEMVGLSAYDVLDEAGQESFRHHLLELDAAPEGAAGSENLECKVFAADGSSRWTLVSHSPVRDDHGRRIGWMHRVTDNTDQRALVDRLQDREGQLAEAQHIAGMGSYDLDLATGSVSGSDELFRLFGLEPSEEPLDAFLTMCHPDDRGALEGAIEAVREGSDGVHWEGRFRLASGELRWIRSLGRAHREPSGVAIHLTGTVQDVTERKAAEHRAAEATRRLELLQAMASAANETNSLDEALLLAAVGLPLYTSWAPIASHRGPVEEPAEAVWVPEYDGWRPGPDPELAARVFRTGQVELAAPVGHEETHSTVGIPILIDRQVVCVLELLADEVPPDENSRKLIEQISAQLSQVAQREASAAALAAARDSAVEASRLKSEFLATMSHEIRTPLNGVIGLGELLLRTELDTGQRRLAEGLQGAGITLRTIIDDILDLSRIESGKLELEVVDFDVRAVFDRTVGLLRGTAEEKGVHLRVECDDAVPPYLAGDPGRLGQVLTNLGSNGVKFTDAGEVSILARVVAASDEDVVLRVEVTDTGVGIPAESHEKIFDAFTQADLSTTREHGGTGLGLAISRQLVELLDGELLVESEPGRGSTFTFTARFGRAAGPTLEMARQTDPGLLHGRRILVIDDNATTRLILRDQLSAWAMQPVVVASGVEARATYERSVADGEPFEIVVIDLEMREENGLALARAITDLSPVEHPRLVLLSSGEHVDATALLVAGISASLTKPVRHDELLRSLVAPLEAETLRATPAPVANSGPRVLVVEDNDVNQMVASGLLEGAGYVVDVVQNGLEAVDALSGDGHPYAAVLMDCRMPGMDGYDATRAIRARESTDQHVPVIAMTASALEGEEQRCRDAGMDDFLTKPVDSVRLLRVIRHWTRDERPPLMPADPRPVPEAPAETVVPETGTDARDSAPLDLERMRMLDEMRRPDGSLFERASANFVGSAEQHLSDIRSAVAAADAGELTERAHKLKGSAANLGLPLVGERAFALEQLGDSGTTDGAAPLLTALEAELARALAALAEIEIHGL